MDLSDLNLLESLRATVLMQGETGMGKELIARFIHARGERLIKKGNRK